QQHLTFCSQADFSSFPAKQGFLYLLFQLIDVFGNRRLRNIKLLCRFRKTKILSYLLKYLKTKINNHYTISFSSNCNFSSVNSKREFNFKSPREKRGSALSDNSGITTVIIRAALAAINPFRESSKTKHSLGLAFNSLAHERYTLG